jgi:hypothetical protein
MDEMTIVDMEVEELERRYGVKAQAGIISRAKGNYHVTVGRKRIELDPGLVSAPLPLEEIIDKPLDAKVILVDDIPVVVIVRRPRRRPCYIIICYIPRPEIREAIDEVMRVSLVKSLVGAGKLPKALGTKIIKSITLEHTKGIRAGS